MRIRTTRRPLRNIRVRRSSTSTSILIPTGSGIPLGMSRRYGALIRSGISAVIIGVRGLAMPGDGLLITIAIGSIVRRITSRVIPIWLAATETIIIAGRIGPSTAAFTTR